MNRWRLAPARYRAVCVFALGLLSIIVVSGAGVRLTGSGLGCDDWPRCNDSKLIDVSTGHAAIEQVNRLFTGLVSLGVVVAVLGSLARVPRRRDLIWMSAGLVAGVIGQIVLGGITVLVDLHPAAVQSHFLLSMVLVANGVVLVRRAGEPDGERRRVVSPAVRTHVAVLGVATLVAITFGTVVTGAGPHAGDEDARRFGIDIGAAARIHSIAVWVSVAVALALVHRLSKLRSDRRRLDGPLTAWVAVGVLQGTVGYVQYFSGVPALLAALHVAGATALWAITVWMWVVTTERSSLASTEVAHELDALVDHV